MTNQSDNNDDQMWEAFNRFHFLCDTHRFQKLISRIELVRMTAELPGDIVDAGAFKGISTIQFAHLLKTYQPNSRSRVVSFDTFDETFPRIRADEKSGEAELMKDYEENAYKQLTESIERLDLGSRVDIARGDIVELLPRYIDENPGFRISLLHCDLDVYEPTLATLRAAWPRLVKGGIIAFDEYAVESWGESDAADQFLAELENPPALKQLPFAPTPTAYCIKV